MPLFGKRSCCTNKLQRDADSTKTHSAGAHVAGAITSDIQLSTVARAYARWAPVYDLVFGAVFDAGRKASIDAFARVTRGGGEIVLVNHLGAEAGLRRAFEQGFAPVARRLGWRPEFRWQRLAQWAERHGGVRLVERRPMPPLGHFSLIRFERLSARADGKGRGADRGRGGWGSLRATATPRSLVPPI